jgi:hypothetical protein
VSANIDEFRVVRIDAEDWQEAFRIAKWLEDAPVVLPESITDLVAEQMLEFLPDEIFSARILREPGRTLLLGVPESGNEVVLARK